MLKECVHLCTQKAWLYTQNDVIRERNMTSNDYVL